MKTHSHFFTDLAAGLLLFGGSLILAQTTTTAKKAPTTTTASSPNAITERQDQFGHASGKQAVESAPSPSGDAGAADEKSLSSAHATEAVQKKHIAGVKYEDRATATTGTAASGTSNEMGINEQGVPSKPVVKPNAMAIKENGISSSKPVAKPHQ